MALHDLSKKQLGENVGKLSKHGSLSENVRCLFNVPSASRAPDADVRCEYRAGDSQV